jgi:predicted metal-dependent phosphoesterase TrpH
MYSKADTHIHTTYSDGLMSPEETVAFIAAQTDLRVIAITDHDTIEGAFVARDYACRHAPALSVIIGQEVTTKEGDVVGLYLKSNLPRFDTAAGAIAAIHAQGGLAVAVHPLSRWSTFNKMRGVGRKIFSLPLDAVEVRNGFPTNILANPLTTWLNRYVGQNLPGLGGSDSHAPVTAGQAATWFPGHDAADLRRAIENNTIRAGGSLWSPSSLARLLRILIKHGLPHYEPPPANLLTGGSSIE